MSKYLVGTLVLLATASPAQEAFGIREGQSLKELGTVFPTADPHMFRINAAPIDNMEADFYLIRYTQYTGVCRVAMIGKSYDGDADGEIVRRRFDSFSTVLSDKYGLPKKFDFIARDAKFAEQGQYAASLKSGERSLIYIWNSDDVSLPKSVSSITLEADALDDSTTFITVAYAFENYSSCWKPVRNLDQQGL